MSDEESQDRSQMLLALKVLKEELEGRIQKYFSHTFDLGQNGNSSTEVLSSGTLIAVRLVTRLRSET